MNLKITCPSKTFLFGEYAVLNGGVALLMSTAPRFTMQVNTRGQGHMQGVHPESPSGLWVRNNRLLFDSSDVQFIDPYEGKGGFGASSAQFVMTHVLWSILRDPSILKNKNISVESIWRAYRMNETVSSEGLRPSGADLVAQFLGGISEFHADPFAATRRVWPTDEFEIVVVHTGKKLATHEHLRGLKRLDTDELEWISQEALTAFNVGDIERLAMCIRDYHAELLEMGLVAEHTQEMVARLLLQPYVLAAKGSGAMGSDLLTIYIRKESRPMLAQTLSDMGLTITATTEDICSGVEIQSDMTMKMSCLPPQKRSLTEKTTEELP